MTSVTTFTKGQPFSIRAKTRTYTDHKDQQGELSVLNIRINDLDLDIHFDSSQELLSFCQKQNISCADHRSRTGVEKYIRAQRETA